MCFVCLPTFRHGVVLLSHTRALAHLAKPRHGWHGMAWRGMVWYGLAAQVCNESWLFVIWQLLKSHPRVLAPVLVARCSASCPPSVKISYG